MPRRTATLQIGWVLLVIVGLGVFWIGGVPVHEVQSDTHGAIRTYDWNTISVNLFTAGIVALIGVVGVHFLERKAQDPHKETSGD